MKTAEEILIEAAALVERPEGWCQGHLFTQTLGEKEIRVCLSGAILAASTSLSTLLGGPRTVNDSALRACRAVELEIGEPYNLPSWNDQPGRTAEEVATLLRNSKRHLQ